MCILNVWEKLPKGKRERVGTGEKMQLIYSVRKRLPSESCSSGRVLTSWWFLMTELSRSAELLQSDYKFQTPWTVLGSRAARGPEDL